MKVIRTDGDLSAVQSFWNGSCSDEVGLELQMRIIIPMLSSARAGVDVCTEVAKVAKELNFKVYLSFSYLLLFIKRYLYSIAEIIFNNKNVFQVDLILRMLKEII